MIVKSPTSPVENTVFSGKYEKPIIQWDVIDITDSLKMKLRFISVNSTWRQGVWLCSDTGIIVDGQVYKSAMLWSDTAPKVIDITVRSTDGKLHLYNIWDKGRGKDSQSYTSGMLIEGSGNIRRYHCNDIGSNPDFTKLVFELESDSMSS